MDNLQGKEIMKTEKEERYLVPQYIRNDVNLYYLPFFSHKKWESKPRRIELEIKEENKILKWVVDPHQSYGTPAFFDKKVFYAFLAIIEEKGLQSPLIPFTYRGLLEKMGMPINGRNAKNIKNAINRIKTTQVQSEGIFYSKEKKLKIFDLFSIFDRVILKDEKYEDPITGEKKVAETNYLVLGSWLYSNLKHGYIAKIDYPLFQSMKPLEARLYEFLLPNFYPILSGRSRDEFFKIAYSELCKFLPIPQYEYESQIHQKFIIHIKSLVKKGILTHYRMHRSKDSKDWIFYFYPNLNKKTKSLPESSGDHEDLAWQKARQKHLRFFTSKGESKKEQSQKIPKIDLSHFPLFSALNPQFLNSACNKFGTDKVEKILDVLQLQYKKSNQPIKNPEALLYSALSNKDFLIPEDYVPRAEREERRRISKAEREALEKQKREEEELEQKISNIISSLPQKKLHSLSIRAYQEAKEDFGEEAFNPLSKILTDVKLRQIIREEYLNLNVEQ